MGLKSLAIKQCVRKLSRDKNKEGIRAPHRQRFALESARNHWIPLTKSCEKCFYVMTSSRGVRWQTQ